jgi:small subunit ribosomal protein S8
MPATILKQRIAQVLKDEGFILDYQVGKIVKDENGHQVFKTEVEAEEPKKSLRVFLKYGPEGERVIRHVQRASTPGLRIYKRSAELRPVLDGLGISIISTSKGIMSDRQARAQRLGGELLCNVW